MAQMFMWHMKSLAPQRTWRHAVDRYIFWRQVVYEGFLKWWLFAPKSSIVIGFSIIFTIHFGVPLFLERPISQNNSDKVCQIESTREDFF